MVLDWQLKRDEKLLTGSTLRIFVCRRSLRISSVPFDGQIYEKMNTLLIGLKNFSDMDWSRLMRFSEQDVREALKRLSELSKRIYEFKDEYGLTGTYVGNLISDNLEDAMSSPAIHHLHDLARDFQMAHAHIRLEAALRSLRSGSQDNLLEQLDQLIREVSNMRARLELKCDAAGRNLLNQIETRLLDDREKIEGEARERLDRLYIITVSLRFRGPRLARSR